jgi:hypothetical protein
LFSPYPGEFESSGNASIPFWDGNFFHVVAYWYTYPTCLVFDGKTATRRGIRALNCGVPAPGWPLPFPIYPAARVAVVD